MKKFSHRRDAAAITSEIGGLKTTAYIMLTQQTEGKSVKNLFHSFPRATGFLRDIINAYEQGDLTEKETAEWLLEYTLCQPVRESHVAVRHRYATTRRSRTELNRVYRLVYHWMIRFKNLHPQTAWQYAQRLQMLASAGHLDQGAEALIERIKSDPQNFTNHNQCLSALKLLAEFEKTDGGGIQLQPD